MRQRIGTDPQHEQGKQCEKYTANFHDIKKTDNPLSP
jgi:hypothetical protein